MAPPLALWTRVVPKAFCMAAIVPVSLRTQLPGAGVPGTTERPYSLAKARMSLSALVSGPCACRNWARVRRSLPTRFVALSGALHLTTTDTVIRVARGAGFLVAGWVKEDFSLPARMTRLWVAKRGALFLVGMIRRLLRM